MSALDSAAGQSDISMLDDFFTRALLAGIGVALVAGPLGCFIVWRRMAYFGAAMAHSALLGVALALLLRLDPMIGVFAVATLVALALFALERHGTLSGDAILGILAHGTLAVGLVIIAFMTWLRIDLLGYLFGDVLAVSTGDIALIYGAGAAVLAVLAAIWRPLLADTVSQELARAEGLPAGPARLLFMVLMAAVMALAIKIIGVLLITSLLIIPAATARRFAGGPVAMAALAAVIGVLAVVGGLYGSLGFDTPSGPSIVVVALALFLLSLIPLPGRTAMAAPPAEEVDPHAHPHPHR
jgi:zinc transport system permease protein